MKARTTWEQRATLAACAAVGALALWHVVTIARAFAARAAFPMDMEWLEGQALEEAWRTTHTGDVTYGDPSLGYQSQMYTPGYFFLIGAIGRVAGLNYLTGRAISIIAFAIVCVVAYRFVSARATERVRGHTLGFVTVGAICASYPAVYGWYDYARVDTVSITLAVVTGVLASGDVTVRRAVVTALAATACVYTKQTMVFYVFWIAIVFALANRRAAAIFVCCVGVVSLGLFVALQWATHGWFWRWMTLGTHQDILIERLGEYEVALVRFAPYVPVLVVVLPYMLARRWLSRTTILWIGMLVCAMPGSVLAYIKAGGAANNLIPVFVIAPILACLTFEDLLAAAPRAWTAPAFFSACAIYLGAHTYKIDRFLPSSHQRQQVAALNAYVAGLPGHVVIPSHPFLARVHDPNGRQLMMMGYGDLFMAGRDGWVDATRDLDLVKADWLLLTDPGPDAWMREPALDHFTPVCEIEDAYATFGSIPSAPRLVFRRSADASREAVGVTTFASASGAGPANHVSVGSAPNVTYPLRSLTVGKATRVRACSDPSQTCRDYRAGTSVTDVPSDLGGPATTLFVEYDVPSCL